MENRVVVSSSLVVLVVLFCTTSKSSKESSIEGFDSSVVTSNNRDLIDNHLSIDHEYKSRMFFKIPDSQNERWDRSNAKEVLNCFGLGGRFSRLLDSILKEKSNGTKALNVTFFARSRKNTERVPMHHGELFSFGNADFDIRRRTIFIVHGFFAHSNEQWIEDMEKALLKWKDVNIFVVEWGVGGNTWNYLKAAINTRTVGDEIATFIGQIANQVIAWYGPDFSNWGPLHLIGHSLGAHICGYASRELRNRGQTKWPVKRITGLDPAQPCFRYSDLSLRLDRSDAEFVDVIHTNGRLLKKLGLGLPYPLGHVDFYPNGGSIQPGCIFTKSSIWNYLPLPLEKIEKTICSHGRSQLYLTESILAAMEKNCTFWAQRWNMSHTDVDDILSKNCDDDRDKHVCIEMGINAEKYKHYGTYFVITGGSSPYCNIDKGAIKEVKKYVEQWKKNS